MNTRTLTEAEIAELQNPGTPVSNTPEGKFLRDDGTWQAIPGGGDFVKGSDDSDDITEGAVNKFMTSDEKTKLAGINAPVHVSTSSGATTTGANTTPVDVSGAVFTYVANAVYRIWVMGRLNSTAATTGVGIHFNLSTAVTAIDVIGLNTLAATGTVTGFSSIADDVSQSVSSGVPTGPLDVPVVLNALLVPGNNTGTCQLRLRSETTAVTELLAGVVMVVERIA